VTFSSDQSNRNCHLAVRYFGSYDRFVSKGYMCRMFRIKVRERERERECGLVDVNILRDFFSVQSKNGVRWKQIFKS
jgi:hypothetical protein